MKDQNLKQQLLKTLRFHKKRMMETASADVFVSSDTNSPGLFFITETFKDLTDNGKKEKLFRHEAKYQIQQPKDLLSVASQRHHLFYKHILNQTVSSNHFPNRKKDYPIALSFIDLSGARYNHHAFFSMPHVHSLFIVPQKTLGRFNALTAENFRLTPRTPKTESIKTVKCDEIGWDWKEIANVMGYSAKTYLSHAGDKYFPQDVRSLLFTMHG